MRSAKKRQTDQTGRDAEQAVLPNLRRTGQGRTMNTTRKIAQWIAAIAIAFAFGVKTGRVTAPKPAHRPVERQLAVIKERGDESLLLKLFSGAQTIYISNNIALFRGTNGTLEYPFKELSISLNEADVWLIK